MQSRRSKTEASPPLDRIARVIDLLVDNPAGLTATQISGSLNLPQPSAYRILRRLEAIRYVETSPNGTAYRPGPRLTDMAMRLNSKSASDLVIGVTLQKLADETLMTSYLAVISGTEVLLVAARTPENLAAATVNPGKVFPIHATAGGRAIMAFRSPEEIAAFLSRAPFEKFTQRTVAGAAKLSDIFGEIREHGHALMRGELASGTWAIAMPVWTNDPPEFAIGLVTLASMVDNDESATAHVRPLLKAAAQALVPHLGRNTKIGISG